MSVEPRQSPGTRGIIYIEYHANMPAEFLVSFGGAKDGAGAFYLGRATGFDPLITLLRKLGLSSSVVVRPCGCSWQNRATRYRA